MLLGIVNWERIPGLELLLADNASVGEVEVHLSMPLYHCFVLHCLSTSLTLILQWPTIFYSCDHWLQQRIQVYNEISFHIGCEDWGVIFEDIVYATDQGSSQKRQVGFDFLNNFISLVLCICPGGHNIIGMISGIVGWESIPCLEALCADNARVADIKVHFCVSPHFVLVVLQAADRAPPLALDTSFNHWLQCRI